MNLRSAPLPTPTRRRLRGGFSGACRAWPDADPTGPDADLNNIDVNFFGAGGWFEVLEDGDGEIVGSVGLRPYRGQRCKAELRKMYLKPSMRGRGLGRMPPGAALKKARDLGFEEIWLETNSKLRGPSAFTRAMGSRR